MRIKICPICHRKRCVEAEDDETSASPCFSCLPAYNLVLKCDEYRTKLRGKTVAVEGLGEEKKRFDQEFYQNEILLSMGASSHLLAFESLYSAYASHSLLLNESPRLIKGIHEDQVSEMQSFLYDLITGIIETFCKEGDGMREFIEEARQELFDHPTLKIYSISKSGKEELPRFDGFANLPSLEPLLKEAEDVAKYAGKWKGTLCRKGGQSTGTRADGDYLLDKLHRCVNTLRVINAALSLSLCPDSAYVCRDIGKAQRDALSNAVKKVIFKMDDLTQKIPS